jgi:hypothetical protein
MTIFQVPNQLIQDTQCQLHGSLNDQIKVEEEMEDRV